MVVIIYRDSLLLLIKLNPHGSTAPGISYVDPHEMFVARVNHVAAMRLYEWLARKLFTLFAILIQLVYLLLLRYPFLVDLSRETRARLADFYFTVV